MGVRFSLYDHENQRDPYPLCTRLREEAPVFRNEEEDFWALSRHADVVAAFRDHERFSNANGILLEPSVWGRAMTGSPTPRSSGSCSSSSRRATRRRPT